MFPYSFAREIAEDLVNELSGFCDRIKIVGSLRRRRQAVHDIDIIAIPRFVQVNDETLFGEPVQDNLLEKRLSQLCLRGELNLEVNGSKIKRFLKTVDDDTIPIDIYIATEQTWWTLLLIRTGSRNHNITLARRAMDLHMHLKADGSGLLTPGGSLIPIHSEEEIFRHLGLSYRSPEERE
jgi:DNA polymerase/3'-5' exonuclease PolX